MKENEKRIHLIDLSILLINVLVAVMCVCILLILENCSRKQIFIIGIGVGLLLLIIFAFLHKRELKKAIYTELFMVVLLLFVMVFNVLILVLSIPITLCVSGIYKGIKLSKIDGWSSYKMASFFIMIPGQIAVVIFFLYQIFFS